MTNGTLKRTGWDYVLVDPMRKGIQLFGDGPERSDGKFLPLADLREAAKKVGVSLPEDDLQALVYAAYQSSGIDEPTIESRLAGTVQSLAAAQQSELGIVLPVNAARFTARSCATRMGGPDDECPTSPDPLGPDPEPDTGNGA